MYDIDVSISQNLPGVMTEAALFSKSREVSPELDGMESEAVFHKEKPCVVEVRQNLQSTVQM